MEKLTKQGVRDLNTLGRPRQVENAPLEPGESIHDLLYHRDAELWDEIRRAFPRAKLEVADDWIKGPRTEIDVAACSLKSWYRFLLVSGYHGASLSFQIDAMGGTKEGAPGTKLIAELLDELRPGWRKRTA